MAKMIAAIRSGSEPVGRLPEGAFHKWLEDPLRCSKCDVTYNLAEANAKLAKKQYDVVVTDLVMEGRREGLDVMREALKKQPPPPVVLVTAHGDVPTCKQALHEGAYDFIEKPLDLDYFRAQVNRAAEKAALQKENQILQAQVMESAGFEGIVGKSAAMQKVFNAELIWLWAFDIAVFGEVPLESAE